MSSIESSASPGGAQSLISRNERSPISLRLMIGVALLALGAGLFALGIFHGFQNGSCSTTGYSRYRGPVPHCSNGIGWWMLMLMAGLVVLGGGAVLSRIGAIAGGVLFIGVGAPFVALGLGGATGHLLLGASSGAGKLSALIFGACFVIAGSAWAVLAGRESISELSGGSRTASLLAAAGGIGFAFVIAGAVSGGIGTSASGRSGSASAPRTALTSAATARQQVNKLAACIITAGSDQSRIQACERKYQP